MSEEQLNTPPPATSAWSKLFTPDGLPQLFQLILGLSSVFYIAGYLCWAFYAWKNNLGYLSAIREQYFVAGFVPTLSIGAVLLFHIKVTDWVRTKKISIRFSYNAFGIASVCFILAVFYTSFYGHLWVLIGSVFLVIITGYAMITHLINVSHSRLTRWAIISNLYNRFAQQLFISGLFLSLLSVYADNFFPNIPRAFGGPKETKVQLDLQREDISPQTLALVSDSVTRADSSKVFRTQPIFLIFDGGDLVLLKQKEGKIDSTNSLLKIKREVIQGIYNCE